MCKEIHQQKLLCVKSCACKCLQRSGHSGVEEVPEPCVDWQLDLVPKPALHVDKLRGALGLVVSVSEKLTVVLAPPAQMQASEAGVRQTPQMFLSGKILL